MKNNRLFKALMLVLISLAWTSCHKDKEMDGKDPVVSNDEITVSSTGARFSWKVDFAREFHTGVELSQNENMTDVRRVEATKQEEKFVAVVSDLSMGKKYYYRIVVWNKFNNYEEEVKNFTTTQTFVVSLACLPEEGGTATGGGTFAAGDTCTVIATANAGYNFVNWTENESQVSMDSVYAFAVMGNRVLVANFQAQPQPQDYTISVSASPTNGGTVTGGGTFTQGESCTVIATAADGYTFSNWTEDGDVVSEDANYTFSVGSDRTLVANFSVQAPNTYNINVSPNPSEGGTVTGGGSYDQGATCTVTATANEGYNFTNWTENGQVIQDAGANYSFQVTGNRTLVANFQQQHYTIMATSNPTDGGTITGIQSSYTYGQTCNLTATPAIGYIFDNWTENGDVVSGSANYMFTVTGDRTLVANFTLEQYTITTYVTPTNSGTVTGGGTYNHGDPCTLTATANNIAQYEFDHWTKNDLSYSGESTIDITVTESATYTAHFRLRQYTITALSNPTNGGNVTGCGTYVYGTNVNLAANPNANFTFDHWEDNTTTNPRTITVTGDATYTAYFIEQPQFPAGAINGKFTINPTGDQVYFSQGNLQYQASTNIWRFSENQWDYVGNESNGTVYENGVKCNNSQISSTYDGWIDLFGFGTSGYDHGANCYLPWSTSQNYWDYYAYGNGQANLYDQSGKADWGYNAIYNGGNIENSGWRTLTNEEWIYVFRDRVSEIRYVRAKVNDVNGMIILPDNWSSSYYPLENVNPPLEVIRGCNYENNIISFEDNIISSVDWFNSFEANGAVFLPAAGGRGGTSVYSAGGQGYYRTSSCSYDVIKVRAVFFNSATFDIGFNDRWRGFCVRLVRNVQ